MIPIFVIFLREGVEALMIVAILLSYLNSTGQRRYVRDVVTGVVAALGFVGVAGVAAYSWMTTYSGSTAQTVFETVTYLVAVVALTYMTLWMARHARDMAGELRRRSEDALERGSRWGLGLVGFQAVGREGLETMVFTLAILFSNGHQAATAARGPAVLAGALSGLLVAALIALAIYRLGRRVNLGRFFRVVGAALLLFAAGLLADAIQNLQQLRWIPGSARPLWSTTGWLSQDSNWGDVAHSLLGYADQPTTVQLVAWLAYLAGAVWLFRRALAPRATRRAGPA